MASSTSDEEAQRKAEKPAITEAEAAALAADLWPATFGGAPPRRIKPLESYDDQNFYVERAADSAPFLLKVHNGVESNAGIACVRAQNAVMLHLAAKGVLSSRPLAVEAADRARGDGGGDGDGDGDAHLATAPLRTRAAGEVALVVRLLTWVAGETMNALGDAVDCALLEDAGRYLGALERALVGFDHAGAHRDHAWDLRMTAHVRPFVPCIADAARRALVEDVVAAFERDVLPSAGALREGVLMADFNDANIICGRSRWPGTLARERVVGVIDFGDVVHSWRVNEVAIAMAYGDTPRSRARPSLGGEAERSLSQVRDAHARGDRARGACGRGGFALRGRVRARGGRATARLRGRVCARALRALRAAHARRVPARDLSHARRVLAAAGPGQRVPLAPRAAGLARARGVLARRRRARGRRGLCDGGHSGESRRHGVRAGSKRAPC